MLEELLKIKAQEDKKKKRLQLFFCVQEEHSFLSEYLV